MFGTTLQRMIFGQLLRVFVLALFGLTGLFLLGGVVQEASQRGLTPGQIGIVIPLLIPTTLPYTVPATVLFATCVVYGRLAHDNEITALRAAGVHLGRLLTPAVIFASIISCAMMVMQYDLIPRSRQMLADRVLADADELIYSMLKRFGCLRHPQTQFAVFVRDVRGKQLIDPVFKSRGEGGTYSIVAHAREATLWADAANNKVTIFMPNCAIVGTDEVDGNFRDHTFEIDFPISNFRDSQVRPMNMTWQQIDTKWSEILELQASRRAELESLHGQPSGVGSPEPIAKLRHHLEYQEKEGRRIERAFAAEKQMRPALALGAIVFVLVAFPVGVWFHRADYLSAFVTCFLPVVMIYYPLVLAGTNLAKEGRVPALLSVWMADALTMFAGAVMLRKLFRQ
ncbi:MAG: LptF/LptG family permease [Gemmataceae bacterium]